MSDYPVAGCRVGWFEAEIEAHGWPERANTFLDVGGANIACFIDRGVHDIGDIDPARGDFRLRNLIALVADISGVVHMDRPAFARPPGDVPRRQIIARQNIHASKAPNAS